MTTEYNPQVGDKVTIKGLGRNGRFTGVVKSVHPNFAAAEEAYEGPYNSILKRGTDWDKDAPHLICYIDNKTKKPIGVCVLDSELKWREPEDED
jgi:hypothetical protein